MNRRHFLQATAAAALAASPFIPRKSLAAANAAEATRKLTIGSRTIEVNGKAASVFGLTGPDGKPGLAFDAGSGFDVLLLNNSHEETLIHWHGLTPPWNMDGVPGNPAALLASGEKRAYKFALPLGGTNWMHAHTLQEQRLLAAPLIVRTAQDKSADEQEVIILLHDFSFRSPEEILATLKGNAKAEGNSMPMDGGEPMMKGMNMSGMTSTGMGNMTGMQDLNDVDYDAFLANDRTLLDPEVIAVEKRGRVRLRVINGASSTAFHVDTGFLEGELIAVDGMDIVPMKGNRFPISMGQRLDIRLELPTGGGISYPILALCEGTSERTGIILAPAGAVVKKLETTSKVNVPALDLSLEAGLRALQPLSEKPVDKHFDLTLTGNMASYSWQISTSDDLSVAEGDRVRVRMRNMSMMAHPMHLHGHHFQIVSLNGQSISGAVRDTILVTPMAEVEFAFDANNRGRWPIHCHHLYHMASGMMDFITYRS